MKRLQVVALVCVWLVVAGVGTGWGGKKAKRTITVSNCKLDYDDGYLSLHRKSYAVKWLSTGGEYVISFTDPISPCTDRQENPQAIFLTSEYNSSNACFLSTDVTAPGTFKYKIWARDPTGALQMCKDPAVIVIDGAVNLNNSIPQEWPGKLLAQGKPLPDDREVDIDEDCGPDTTPNLYQSDPNTLVWTADKGEFKIEFENCNPGPSACVDGSGVTMCKFKIKQSGPNPGKTDTCNVDKRPTTPTQPYLYHITRTDTVPPNVCKQDGNVNLLK